MSRKIIYIIFGCFLLLNLSNCEKKESGTASSKKESSSLKETASNQAAADEVVSTKEPTTETLLVSTTADASTTDARIASTSTVKTPAVKTTTVKTTTKPVAAAQPKEELQPVKTYPHYKIYTNVKILLSMLKIGQSMTKEELMASKKLPPDALQSVNKVTKISENELAIKWKSKWMLESISDVRLKDARVKVALKDGLLYTSGSAIGIECDNKVYTNLIIKGDKAYIPSVKGYSWKIGA